MKKDHDRYSLHHIVTHIVPQAKKLIVDKLLEIEVELEEVVAQLLE